MSGLRTTAGPHAKRPHATTSEDDTLPDDGAFHATVLEAKFRGRWAAAAAAVAKRRAAPAEQVTNELLNHRGLELVGGEISLLGRPVHQSVGSAGPGTGWSWLVDVERVDHYMSFAVADVAFLVTTHCLERGDVEQARAAAEIGTLAAPHEEATRLCLARVVEAERIVREGVCNRSDDGDAPAELSDRTQAIIRSRAWLTGESAAS